MTHFGNFVWLLTDHYNDLRNFHYSQLFLFETKPFRLKFCYHPLHTQNIRQNVVAWANYYVNIINDFIFPFLLMNGVLGRLRRSPSSMSSRPSFIPPINNSFTYNKPIKNNIHFVYIFWYFFFNKWTIPLLFEQQCKQIVSIMTKLHFFLRIFK